MFCQINTHFKCTFKKKKTTFGKCYVLFSSNKMEFASKKKTLRYKNRL